jgi:uncharacterized protein with FMN-binding domain
MLPYMSMLASGTIMFYAKSSCYKEKAMRRTAILTILAAMAAAGAFGASRASKADIKTIHSAKEQRLVSTMSPVKRVLEFPMVKVDKTDLLVVRFRARVDTEDGIYSHSLGLKINGKAVGPVNATSRRARLINRATALQVRERGKKKRYAPLWGRSMAKAESLLIPHTTRSSRLDRGWKSDRDEGAWYLIDISDLHLKRKPRKGSSSNKIEFINNLLVRTIQDGKRTLVVDRITIGTMARKDALSMQADAVGKTTADKVAYADGVYEGEAKVKGFRCKVSVTIKEGRITEIKLLKIEDRRIGIKAKVLVPKIIEAQSTRVDAVSGATNTSQALRRAVDQALAKSLQKTGATATPEKKDEDKDG